MSRKRVNKRNENMQRKTEKVDEEMENKVVDENAVSDEIIKSTKDLAKELEDEPLFDINEICIMFHFEDYYKDYLPRVYGKEIKTKIQWKKTLKEAKIISDSLIERIK